MSLVAKKLIYLDSGHSLTDPGTTTQYGNETDFNRKIRDALIPELIRNGFEVQAVPDELNLSQSISWVNQRSSNISSGLALAIHCNCCGQSGAETYYFGNFESSRKIALALINGYCQETGIANRGAKSDTITRFGELSWIRNTTPFAALIECGFLDNSVDVEVLKDYKKIARGICRGVCTIYGVVYIKEDSPPSAGKEEIKNKIIELLKQL